MRGQSWLIATLYLGCALVALALVIWGWAAGWWLAVVGGVAVALATLVIGEWLTWAEALAPDRTTDEFLKAYFGGSRRIG